MNYAQNTNKSINTKTASPLQVQDQATSVDHMPGTTSINFELTKQTLDTMLDGLGKIRDQLSSVAKTTS